MEVAGAGIHRVKPPNDSSTVTSPSASPSSGSRFGDPTTDANEEAIRARHGGARVLIADDDMLHREVMRALLEDVGLCIDEAEDGSQAAELAGQTDYALILMDGQMPVLDGFDATRRIRASERERRVPIIATTANTFAEDKADCQEAGMDGFLGKPVQVDQLFNTVLAWLDKRPDGQPGA